MIDAMLLGAKGLRTPYQYGRECPATLTFRRFPYFGMRAPNARFGAKSLKEADMDLAKLTRPLQSTRTLVAASLLCLAATPALAQDTSATVGDWSYGLDQGVAGASTMNRDQQRFGIVCTENCIGFIESDRPCPENAEFDGVMRSAAGEEATRFVCRHVEGRYVLVLTPTEALLDATAQSTAIRFTVPIEPLAPLVFQFSLDGAYDAISLTLAGAIANASPGTSGPPESQAPHHGI